MTLEAVTRDQLSPTCYAAAGCTEPRLTYSAYCRGHAGLPPVVAEVCQKDRWGLPESHPLRCYCRRHAAGLTVWGGAMGGTDLKKTRALAGNVSTLEARQARSAASGLPPLPPGHLAPVRPLTGRAAVGTTAPQPSQRAAVMLEGPPVGKIRAAVFGVVAVAGSRGATDDEIEQLTGRPHQSVSSARNALVAAGYLEDSGAQRDTSRGFAATVWRPTEAAAGIAARIAAQPRL